VIMSDTHERHSAIVVPDGDVLIHAGDFTMNGNLRKVRAFGRWLRSLPHAHKIVVAGKHELTFEFQPRRASAELGNGNDGLTYLQDSGILIDGISFWGSPWQPAFLYLAPADRDTAIDEVEPIPLADFGLSAPRPVPCLAIVEQVAQKIHALTEPNPRGRPNARARDVIDVLALDARISLNYPAVANACERVFAIRAGHDWPIISYEFPSKWKTTLPAIAQDARYDTTDAAVIATRFSTFLARLYGVNTMPGYEYQFVALAAFRFFSSRNQ
jgi:hypothetical protein